MKKILNLFFREQLHNKIHIWLSNHTSGTVAIRQKNTLKIIFLAIELLENFYIAYSSQATPTQFTVKTFRISLLDAEKGELLQ